MPCQYCRLQLIPRSLSPKHQFSAKTQSIFFVLRKWMFCKWDVPIVPCVSFQNALFCGPHGLTFTWWGHCGLHFWYKPTELAQSFFFCSFVYFLCLHDPFNCISFHKFSRQLSSFSLCSSSLVSALLVLLAIYLFMKVSFSILNLCGWLGLKHQLTN